MKRFTASILVLLLLFGGAKPVSATTPSESHYQSGVDRTGIILANRDCPIVLESEQLTFDIQDFPQSHYESEAEFLAYPGKITANYTIYNPTDSTVTAKLLFPILEQPQYGTATNVDTTKYDILVNNQPVEKNIRHTLSVDPFVISFNLPSVSDSFIEDDFFTPNLTVTAYEFSVTELDRTRYPKAMVGFDVSMGTDKRFFYLSNSYSRHQQDNGNMRLLASATDRFFLYVLGKPLDTVPEFAFYENSFMDSQRIHGKASLIDSVTMTFTDFALKNWSEETGVSELDWYNATVTDYTIGMRNTIYPTAFWSYNFQKLVQCYEYEITLEPGQRVVNTVTAPIYPSIDEDYEPAVYSYRYLLSAEKSWQNLGEFDILINTPYSLLYNSFDGFEKTDSGYKLSYDDLSHRTCLTFNLSSSENPEKIEPEGINWAWLILLVAPFLLIAEAFEAIGDFFTNLFQNLF